MTTLNNLDAQERVYLDAQDASGIVAGDFVRITRSVDSFCAGWDDCWTPGMYSCVGRCGQVLYLGGLAGVRVEVDGCGTFSFPYFVLEVVDTARGSRERPSPLCGLEPGEKVLVRDTEDRPWALDMFGYASSRSGYYVCTGGVPWKYCLPYDRFRHLLGTTDTPASPVRGCVQGV